MTVSIFDGDQGSKGEFPVAEALGAAETIDAIVACVARGAMVSVGLSRDGGALSLSVMSGGRSVRKWAGELDEWTDILVLYATAAARGDFDQPPQTTAKRT